MAEKDVKQMATELVRKAILSTPWGTSLSEGAVSALAAAGLLHDPAEVAKMRDLVVRLSAGAAEAYRHGNLLGCRIGFAEDFCDPAEVARGKEALEACAKYASLFSPGAARRSEGGSILAVGRAELERRKPKVRWTVMMFAGAWYAYLDGNATGFCFPPDAEPEARAYVARKNAEGK